MSENVEEKKEQPTEAVVETPSTPEVTEDIENKDSSKATEEKPEKESDASDSIFITEEDTFDVQVKWYKRGEDLLVEGSEDEFDAEYPDINEFTVTFKYPSQGDYEIIMNSSSYRSPDEMRVSDVLQMELTRMVTLVRSWDLKQELSRMVELDPSIIRGILKKMRDIIGMKGIL